MTPDAVRAERTPLDQAVLTARLQAVAWPWPPVTVTNTTRSTNADVATAATQGAPHGTVVTSDFQSAGRGRLGRIWEAPPNSSVMFSVLFRTNRPIPEPGWLPLLVGTSVAESLTRVTGVRITVKWPNDLMAFGRKLGGILIERAGSSAYIVGVGINADLRAEELPTPEATSLFLEGSRRLVREDLLTAVLAHLAAWWERWEYSGFDSVRSGLVDAYTVACATIGARVTVSLPDGETFTGMAIGVGADGALLVRADLALPNEPAREIRAADVVHVRPA